MTYLELVNAVLRRLREDEVSIVNESEYSKMIGDFVNDAKRLAEDSWDWTGLYTEVPITTVSGQNLYTLTGFKDRSKVITVHNETDNCVVRLESLKRIRQLDLGSDSSLGTPIYYCIDSLDSNGDLRIRLYQTPNSAKELSVYGIKRTGLLVEDTDAVLIPSNPIVQWAYAYALRERGETGGQSVSEQALFAQNDLATAISLDAAHHPEDLIWETV